MEPPRDEKMLCPSGSVNPPSPCAIVVRPGTLEKIGAEVAVFSTTDERAAITELAT